MSRFRLVVDFDDRLATHDDGVLQVQLAASLAVAALRDCSSITVEGAVLTDELEPIADKYGTMVPCLSEYEPAD